MEVLLPAAPTLTTVLMVVMLVVLTPIVSVLPTQRVEVTTVPELHATTVTPVRVGMEIRHLHPVVPATFVRAAAFV